MKQTLIKTPYYLLVVDESVINLDDWVYTDTEVLFQYGIEHKRLPSYRKVLACLPLGMSSNLEGVPLLPPLEVEDVEKLAEDSADHFRYLDLHGYVSGFVDGFNKAREKYSLSNILDLYIKETARGMDMWSKEENETMTTIGNIIESLSQPKLPTHFKFEMERADVPYYVIKTTINPQGEEVVCGKYIYQP